MKYNLFFSVLALSLGALLLAGCEDKESPLSPLWRDWQNGDSVPGYVLGIPQGSRADVLAKGQNWDGWWEVEFASYLNTGNGDDHVFSVGSDLVFSVYIADESDSVFNGKGTLHLVWNGTSPGMDSLIVYDLATNSKLPPTIDGKKEDEAWNAAQESELAQEPVVGDNGLDVAYMSAAHDGVRIYFRISWPDPTTSKSVDRERWTFDGRDWSRDGGEDLLAFVFPNDNPPSNWVTEGANSFFPGAPSSGSVNIWSWRAARTNPVGYADDEHASDGVRDFDAGQPAYEPNFESGRVYPLFVQHPQITPSLGDHFLLKEESIRFEDTVKP